jgi:hypothetical protein
MNNLTHSHNLIDDMNVALYEVYNESNHSLER